MLGCILVKKWERIYFLAVICVSTRHATVTFIWPDYANLRKLYCPVATCVLGLWHFPGATTTRRTLNLFPSDSRETQCAFPNWQ